jgi:hypothetical protein
MDMTDWDEEVDIEAPPADQVTDVPDMSAFQTPPSAA